MANGGPGTDGSQLLPHVRVRAPLDGKHTIFGQVIAGMETLKGLGSLRQRVGAPPRSS